MFNYLFAILMVYGTSAECRVASNEGSGNSNSLQIVDSYIDRLKQLEWNNGEEECLRNTLALFEGLKNQTLWSNWVWNSMQLPTGTFQGSRYSLGSFDQCMQAPGISSHSELRTQYCLVDVKMAEEREYEDVESNPFDSTSKLIGMKTAYGKRLNLLTFGVCLPAACKPESVAKISQVIYQHSYLPLQNLYVDPRDCQMADAKENSNSFMFWFTLVFVFLWLIPILNYMMCDENVAGSRSKWFNGTASKIFNCFCLRRNYGYLTNIRKSEIDMMNGMRAISCGTVVVAHYMVINNMLAINHLNKEKISALPGSMLIHLDLCVDTFFVMSGLLFTKGLVGKNFNPAENICKRYLRLVVPSIPALLYFTFGMPSAGTGPLWPRLQRKYGEPCVRKWWWNLLMISNRFGENGICMLENWYVSVDFQLNALATLLFILCRKHRRTGIAVFGFSFVISVVAPGLITYWLDYPGLLLYDLGDAHDIQLNKVLKVIYPKVYNRASSYLIGMVLGYFMAIYKPEDYRKAINKMVSIVGSILAFSLMLLVLYLGTQMFIKQYRRLGTALIVTLDRNVWSIGICILIIVCEYGTLPAVNDLLGCSFFISLNRLSYGAYLNHTVLMIPVLFHTRAPITYGLFSVIINGLGFVVVSAFVSFLNWFVLEAPVVNLTNLLFDKRDHDAIKNNTNGVSVNNGIEARKTKETETAVFQKKQF